MSYIVPITEFRKNIFALTEKISRTGEEIEIEKEGKRIAKLIPLQDDPAARAAYALEHVLPKLVGIWKNMPEKEFKQINEFIRGKKEKLYWKRKQFR